MESELSEWIFQFKIIRKPLLSHLIDYPWLTLISTSLGSVGILWTLVDLTSNFTGIVIKGFENLLLVWLISVILGSIISFRKYILQCPVGLEDECKDSQRIAIFKKRMWRYKLAHSLLSERINKLDKMMSDINGKRVFVPLVEINDIPEYLAWAELRRKNLLRFIEVFKALVFEGLLSVIANSSDESEAQILILYEVRRIEELYRATIEFEKEGIMVVPPDKCIRLHEIQNGWTSNIRDGVRDVGKSIKNASSVPITNDTKIIIEVTMKKPESFAEFEQEFLRVSLCL